MNKIILVILSFVISSHISAYQLTMFKSCSKINKNQLRLECYDKTANVKTVKAQKNIVTKSIIPEKKSKAKAFGLTNTKQIQAVESSIVGVFKGWIKGDKIHLKNGQIWKVKSQSTGYVKLNNPKIKISRGFLSSFNAKVEGLNAKAKVKRLK